MFPQYKTFPLYKTPQLKSMENLDAETVRWSDQVGQSIIKSAEFKIGDTIIGTTAPKHQGASLDLCPWCRNKKPLAMSIWGDTHVFNNQTKTWTAYQNGNPVDSIPIGWIEIMKDLSRENE